MARRDESVEGCGSGDELTPGQKGRRLLLMGGASAALGAAFGASGQAPAVLASVLGFPVLPLPGANPSLCRVAANPATAAFVANPGGPPRKLRLENLEDDPDPSYIPVVLAGSVGNVRIFDAIEETNGAIVGWVYHGVDLYREDIPPLEALAHYVLDAQSKGDLGEAVGASVAYRRNLVAEEVRRTSARGIISSSVTGCPYASLMQQLESDHFKALGIPLIALETDVHKEPPTEEQIMRIKAFMEMLA